MDEETLRVWIDRFEHFAWGEGDPLPPLPGPDVVRQALANLPSDESLALLIRRGFVWKEAFEELFVHRYGACLMRWFRHWRPDAERAAELTQALFCRFLESRLSTFDPARSFRAYLYQAARNLAIEMGRRESRIHSLDSIPEPLVEEKPPATELLEQFESSLRSLPDPLQHVLRETVAGRSAEDIARDVGLPRRRVYALLYQARRRVERDLLPRDNRIAPQKFLPPKTIACQGVST
jgi:RNA polymerase sigma factor (sigma-70 family)